MRQRHADAFKPDLDLRPAKYVWLGTTRLFSAFTFIIELTGITRHLSKREEDILKLVAQEFSNARIAETLFISERTVETHRARVIKKLGFKSTADLIRYAIKNNLLTP